jgi:transmembrane sensor
LNNLDFNITISDELLARYVEGEATAIELQQIEEWQASSASNQAALKQWLLIWEASKNSPPQKYNTDQAWQQVQSQLNNQTITKPLARSPWLVWRWAASIVTALGLGWMSYKTLNTTEKIVSQTIETKQDTLRQLLPDGTVVFLNHRSKITLDKQFDQETRSIALTGEAFFEVAHDKNRPFIIDANGSQIKVLGTSFGVNAYTKKVQVTVETGRVEFATPLRKAILTKGEQATAQSDTIWRPTKTDLNALAYHSQIFMFDKTTLTDVVASLREGYHTDIRLINSQIATCQLTAKFEKQSLQTTLAVIAETLNLTIKQEGKVILIGGRGCH